MQPLIALQAAVDYAGANGETLRRTGGGTAESRKAQRSSTSSKPKGPQLPPAWVVRRLLGLREVWGRGYTRMVPPEIVPIEHSFRLILNKSLMVAVELGIADQLEAGPRTAEELALIVGANPDALDRMLAFLVSAGLLGRSRDGKYKNNAVSNTLRKNHPRSPRDWVLFAGADWIWDAWNQLGHSVRTGESGMVKAHGTPFFDYVSSSNPAAGSAFTRALAFYSRLQGPILAAKYDFSAVNRLCDVGGGSGTLLVEVLKVHPNVNGVLFEVPEVLAAAKENLATQGLADRCEFVGGNFLESVPTGCDHYLLQFVLHDWSDDSCATILGNLKTAMRRDGKVLVIENVLEANGRDPWTLRASDLLMLVLTGSGRERTRDEFAALFQRTGFRLARDVTLPSLAHVFELVPVDPPAARR